MKILQISELAIPEIKIIRYLKINDERGYFSETFNINAIKKECDFLNDFLIKQSNESFSFSNTLRGLHHQKGMGKLIRLIYGKVIDFALDLRPNSPTFKHIVSYELLSTCEYCEWIWLPPGFGHGIWTKENSMIEYFCTETYSPDIEDTISFFSKGINWSLCESSILESFINVNKNSLKIKEKDLISTLTTFF